MKIKTNNIPRPVLYGFELTEQEAAELDYLGDYGSEELASCSFFKYKGEIYDLGEFFTTSELHDDDLKKWDGYQSDSHFSGLLVKYIENGDSVIVASYCG